MRAAVTVLALLATARADFVISGTFTAPGCAQASLLSYAATAFPAGSGGCAAYTGMACASSGGGLYSATTCQIGTTLTPPQPASPAQGYATTAIYSAGACGLAASARSVQITTVVPTGTCVIQNSTGSGLMSLMYTCNGSSNYTMSYFPSTTDCSGMRVDNPRVAPLCTESSYGSSSSAQAFVSCTGTATPPGTPYTGGTGGSGSGSGSGGGSGGGSGSSGGGGGGGGGSGSGSPPPACAGATLATAPSAAPLNCFVGSMDTSATNTSGVSSYNLAAMQSGQSPADYRPPTFNLCGAVTITCGAPGTPTACRNFEGGFLPAGTTTRSYFGADTLANVPMFALGPNTALPSSSLKDMLLCTTSNCNNPTTDACAIPATLSAYGSYNCGGSPILPAGLSLLPVGAPANPAAAPAIPCWSNSNASSGVPTLQATATAGNVACLSVSVPCGASSGGGSGSGGPAPPNDPCFGKPASTVVRRYAALAETGLPLQAISYLLSSLQPYVKGNPSALYDIALCYTAGCNAPSGDACALATAAITASVQLSSLPATALASGQLTPAAKAAIEGSLRTALRATAGCTQCLLTLQSVAPAAGGAPFYTAGAARALQATGPVLVTFTVSGGTPAALAALSTASTTPAFTDQLTTQLATANPTLFAGVSAVAVGKAPQAAAAATSATLAIGLGVGLGALAVVVGLVLLLRSRSAGGGNKAVLGSKGPAYTVNPAKAKASGTEV
jgi:hypothetical protein